MSDNKTSILRTQTNEMAQNIYIDIIKWLYGITFDDALGQCCHTKTCHKLVQAHTIKCLF